MEEFISFAHVFALACLPVATAAVFVKSTWIIGRKGFDLPAIIVSFFRIYSPYDKEQTGSKSKRVFMTWNNRLNYFIYFTLALFSVILIIYQKSVFDYSL